MRAGLVKSLSSVWPGIALLAGIGAVSVAMRAPAPKAELAPAPPGWTRFTETGASICLAVRGREVYVGGKTGLWVIGADARGPAQRVRLPVDPIHIRSLEAASDGSLWIGHLDGLIQMREGRFQQYSKADGLPGNRVNCVREIDGRIVAGTSGGIAEWDGTKWRQPKWAGRLASKVVNTICRTKDGSLWVGSSSDPNGGLARVQGSSVQVWRAKDGLPHPYVQDILPAGDGAVWAATGQFEQGGAVLVDAAGGKAAIKRRLTKADGLAGNKVRSLGVDESGSLWFGSENDGLAVLGPRGFRVWTAAEGLPHNEITCIRRDAEGNMWLATLNGAVRISREAAYRMVNGGNEK